MTDGASNICQALHQGALLLRIVGGGGGGQPGRALTVMICVARGPAAVARAAAAEGR